MLLNTQSSQRLQLHAQLAEARNAMHQQEAALAQSERSTSAFKEAFYKQTRVAAGLHVQEVFT